MSNIYLTGCGLAISILISIVFFVKGRIKNIETEIFKNMLLLNILESTITTLIIIVAITTKSDFVLTLLNRLDVIVIITWCSLMFYYIYKISRKNSSSIVKKIIIILNIIMYILALILDVTIINSNGIMDSKGPLTILGLVGAIIYIFMMLCIIFFRNRNYVTLKNTKYIPLYLLVFLLSVIALLRISIPEINFISVLISFIDLIMYFTIENPDLKIVEELYKNKRLVEKTYEDKSNFLFEMTQEVREPLFKINNLCKEIDEEKDTEVIKEGVKLINTSVKQLDFVVNDVLDVTSLDIQKVRMIKSNYSLDNLYEDIVTRTKGIIPKDIEFRTNITSTSKYLYGDNIKLKQIIMSILMNSIKKTEKGYIEFDIDTIERYDVVRLVVKIIDSGSGMSIDKINDILDSTGEINSIDIENMEKMELNLELCQKIIKLLGGNLMIKNGEEKGTEVILTIDQKVKQEESLSVLNKYGSYINRLDSILIVSQNKKLVENIKKKLKDKELNITTSLFGKDAIDKIKSGKSYKLILMDDEMKDINGYTTFKELESMAYFKTPVVIMLDNLKDKIKEQYIKDGFDSYLMIENFNEEIDKIINKYIG